MLSIEKQILFLLTKVPSLSVKKLIEIYTARGYTPQSIRNVIAKHKKLGYVESIKRSYYRLTEHGKKTLYSIANKGIHYGEDWNGEWQLVTYDIPEVDRTKRYHFRNALLNLGFAALHKNTYISPWDYVDEVNRIVEATRLEASVKQIKGRFQHFIITPEKAYTMWNLEKIKLAHDRKWEWYHQTFIPKLKINRDAKEPLQIFIQYLELGEEMGELAIIDPMLPAELLPPHWRGAEIMGTFYQCFSSLHQEVPTDAYYYPLMIE